MEVAIVLFIPSILSIKIHNLITKNKSKDTVNLTTTYLIYVLMNYIFSITFSIVFWKLNISLTKVITEYSSFAIKYLIVAIAFAVVAPFVLSIIENNVKLKLEKIKNEK